MEEIWGWLIVIYLFMGGLGAGAFLTSFAAGRGWIGNSPALQRVGYFISGPIVAVGTLLLVFDLGQGLKKPWLLIGLIMNLRSVMTWGVYILACFIVVGLIVGFLTWKKKVVPKVFLYAGAFLALATGTYTGLLVAVVKGVPFWNTYLMPVLFVVSALSTGMSITSIVSAVIEKGQKTDELKVCKTHIVLVGSEVVLLLAIFASMLSGRHGVVGIESANMILSGSLSLAFWILLVAVGLILPLAVFIMNYIKLSKSHSKVQAKVELASASSRAVQSGAHSEEIDCSRSLLTVDAGVVIGGFILRYVVIFAALPIWNGILK